MTLTTGSLFAGVGGFDHGLSAAAIETRWAVEIDPQCRRVLAERFPDAALFEDVRDVGAHNLTPVDIITFGSPCQDLSVAGNRKGFAGERSGLYHEAIRIIGELGPTIAVWENVPGAFSSNRGADFGAAIGALVELGARDVAWATLDAQWFGVPQRRRRIFVIADFGGERAAEILALADGLRGDSAPRREAGQGVTSGTTPSLTASGRGVSRAGESRGQDPVIPTYWDGGQLSDTLDVSMLVKGQLMPDKRRCPVVLEPQTAHTLRGEGFDASEDGTGRGTPLVAIRTANTGANGHGIADEVAHTLDGANGQAIAFTCKDSGQDAGDVSPTLRAMPHDASHANGGGQVAVAFHTANSNMQGPITRDETSWTVEPHSTRHAVMTPQMAVRRLTPTECARLQGFPDDWLDITPPLSDSAKYRMLGNAVCCSVSAWLGRQLATVLADVRQEAA